MADLNTPLTKEENEKRLLFIGRAVDKNAAFPHLLKTGMMIGMTVQELTATNEPTLINYGQKIEKLEGVSNSRFNRGKEVLVGGFPVSEVLDFISFTIRKKNADSDAIQKRNKITNLKNKLADLRTPEELRKDLEKELAGLEEVPVAVAETA